MSKKFNKEKMFTGKHDSLIGLLFLGLLLIGLFYVGGNVHLLKETITNWPTAIAKITSIDQKTVCDTPEQSGACYSVFTIHYVYSVSNGEYTGQTEQMYATNYSPGMTLDVYYKKNSPQLAFVRGKIPSRFNLYLPLLVGLIIAIPTALFLIHLHRRQGR
ncbi:MAG: DUF3592 domain-containing protein [Candidatus Omnitrophota bacterium]